MQLNLYIASKLWSVKNMFFVDQENVPELNYHWLKPVSPYEKEH